jgi:CRP/FNR family transcriptional regulator
MEQPRFTENLYNDENNYEAPCGEPNLPCLGHLKKLFDCKTLRVVPPQHEIFSQGESPHTVCLICSGLVKLTRTESDGARVIVGLRHAGWLLGAGALLPGRPYASTAETVTRSKLCFVPTEEFKQAMETNALFSQWIAMTYGREVYSSMINISEKCGLSGRQRLEKFLWELIVAQNGPDPKGPVKIQMILKNWEMAQLLALTPQHLCRLIKQLENEGIIIRKMGWVILPKPKRLWHSEMGPKDIS